MSREPARSVRSELLRTAQKLIQQRGYNAVSYYELARQVGVKTATIHYYFPTKADLAIALIDRYSATLEQRLDQIAADSADPFVRLGQFTAIFRATYSDDAQICLGGMLAAEYLTLAPAAQGSLRAFFRSAEAWLAGVLADGSASGALDLPSPPAQLARAILALLEGTLLVARTFDDTQRLDDMGGLLQSMLARPSPGSQA